MKIASIVTVGTWLVGVIGVQVHSVLFLMHQGVNHKAAFWATIPVSFLIVGCAVFTRMSLQKKTPNPIVT